jgi:nucleoside-triphosphatase THEP1
MRKNILLIGEPKSGKSYAVESCVEKIHPSHGFLTKEIKTGPKRSGFVMLSHDGISSPLADVSFVTNFRVAKYYVNPSAIEKFMPQILNFSNKELLYIDEMGEMQLLSNTFKKVTINFLNSENTCLSTLPALFENDFLREIKLRKDIIKIELNSINRERMLMLIPQLIQKIKKAKAYATQKNRFQINDHHVVLSSEHGNRTLKFSANCWNCTCDFYISNKICSHVLSVEEVTGVGLNSNTYLF